MFDNMARSKSSDGVGSSQSMYLSNRGPSAVGGFHSGLWASGAPLVAVCVDLSHAHQVYVVSDYMQTHAHIHTCTHRHTHACKFSCKVGPIA